MRREVWRGLSSARRRCFHLLWQKASHHGSGVEARMQGNHTWSSLFGAMNIDSAHVRILKQSQERAKGTSAPSQHEQRIFLILGCASHALLLLESNVS